MNPPQSGTSLTGDAVQTIGGRNTRGDKSDSPGRRNEIFASTHTCGRSVPSGAGRGTHVVCGSACLPRAPERQAGTPPPPATEYTGSRGNPVAGVVAANVPSVPCFSPCFPRPSRAFLRRHGGLPRDPGGGAFAIRRIH